MEQETKHTEHRSMLADTGRISDPHAIDAITGSGRETTGRSPIQYKVLAEYMPAMIAATAAIQGEPDATIFSLAYLATEVKDRPICFVFNGGPGASSAFLNLGALGPKRVVLTDDGSLPVAPYRSVDNQDTWLDLFDLVFVDPPGTGYSKVTNAESRQRVLSVDGDVALLADFVRRWIDQQQRWGAPVYLVGESYGTTRVGAMTESLLNLGITVNGLILISSALDAQALTFSPKNDLPYALIVPAFANIAHFHGRLPSVTSAQVASENAGEFIGELLAALTSGNRLPHERRSEVIERYAALTGLTQSFISNVNMRVTPDMFAAELLRDKGLVLGKMDARVTAPHSQNLNSPPEFDVSTDMVHAPFSTAIRTHLADLGVTSEDPYVLYSPRVEHEWHWSRANTTPGLSLTSTASDLSRTLRRNPNMSVFVASGLFDLNTPHSATDWSLAQLDVPLNVYGKIRHERYQAGHMIYTRHSELVKLKSDVLDWFRNTANHY